MAATEVITALTLLAFGAIGIVSLRDWRRGGGAPARWVFVSFALLAAVTATLALLPDESRSDPAEALRKVAIAALALFPYTLFRFTAAIKPASRAAEWVASALTALVVLATAAVPAVHLAEDEGRPGWFGAYVAALLVQWAIVSALVAIRLWRAGRGQPNVARRRMGTLAVGSLGMTLALVLAGAASDDGALGAVIRVAALVSGVLFFVAFAPPRWLRAAWRRPEEERMRDAVGDLIGATSRDEVTASLLPQVVELVGGRAAALVAEDGTVLGSHRAEPAMTAEAGVRGGAPVELELRSGRLIVEAGPYTPFFGRDELGLLRSLGALAELALERCDLFRSEQEARLALERQTRFSQGLVESSVDGILAFDRELRYTIWNPGMERITGLHRSQVLGRRALEVFPFLAEIGEDRYLHEALAGRHVTSSDRPYAVPEAGQEGFFESRYSPLHGDGGEIIGGLAVVRDTTDRKRAEDERERRLLEQAARAEAEATAEMVQGLQRVTDTALAHLTLDDLADELIGRVRDLMRADAAAILLLEPDGETLVVQAAKRLEKEVDEGFRVRLGQGFAGRVAADRRPLVVDEVEPGDIAIPRLRELGLRSLLGVPMFLGDRLLGVLYVGSLEPRRFSADDVALLQLVGDRAAVAIDHAGHYRREHEIAATLQRSLLPARLPELPGVAVAARYLPGGTGAVGGDWYDVLALPGGRVCLAMGDVVGHGVGAAALMGQLRSALRAYALEGDGPGAVLRRLDRFLESLEREGMATLSCLVFDPDAGTVRYASAGHPPPLVRGPDRAVRELGGGQSVPLGVVPLADHGEAVETLERGSTIVLYTDGLVERRGASMAEGLERLRQAVSEAPNGVEELGDHVLGTLLPDGAGSDDAALIALQHLPVPLGAYQVVLPAEPRALASLRLGLRRWLEDAGLPGPEAYEALVACGEACANVVEHAYGPGEASFAVEAAIAEGELTIAVRDRGRWRPPRGAHRGRGLGLMRALMDTVDFDRTDGGTSVILRRRLRQEALV